MYKLESSSLSVSLLESFAGHLIKTKGARRDFTGAPRKSREQEGFNFVQARACRV